MTKDEAIFLETRLREMLVFISSKVIDEQENTAKIIEFRKSFSLLSNNEEVKVEKDFADSESKQEEESMKRKYGQGSIIVKKRERKDGSIYKYYEGRYYCNGKIKSVYGKTLKECEKLLNQAVKQRKKSSAVYKDEQLQEWLETWYSLFKQGSLRTSTQRAYNTLMNYHIIPALGKIRLSALKGEEIQAFLKTIKAGNTRKKVLMLLSACLEKAVRLRKIKWNPCLEVELPKYKKAKRRAFTYEEQAKILSEAPPKFRQVFFFLCCTGLRVGEFLALTKEDFYFEDHFFVVNKAIACGEEGDPKTETSNRIIDYTDELLEKFDLSLLGTFTYDGIRSAFRRLNKKLNLENVTIHSTRHTFATICFLLGMNEKKLQTLLGHATLAMTQDTYTHLMKRGSSEIRSYLEGLCSYIRTTI